jgi:hypothetical protein
MALGRSDVRVYRRSMNQEEHGPESEDAREEQDSEAAEESHEAVAPRRKNRIAKVLPGSARRGVTRLSESLQAGVGTVRPVAKRLNPFPHAREAEALHASRIFSAFATPHVRPRITSAGLAAILLASRKPAIEFAGSAALFASETPIMRATRDVMDNDAGFFQRLWNDALGNEDVAHIVNASMDRVPGSPYSGGFFHRHHGHDLNAGLDIFTEHGPAGLMEWFNHVWFRDFWTPDGIPLLPTGTKTIYDWLISKQVTPRVAADLLTINAVEVTGTLLLIRSGISIMKVLREYRASKLMSKLLETAQERDKIGSWEAAAKEYSDLEAMASDKGDVRTLLLVAQGHLGAAITASDPVARDTRASNAYSVSRHILVNFSRSDDTIELDGGHASTVGLAGLVLAAAANRHYASHEADLAQHTNHVATAAQAFARRAENTGDPRRLSRSLNRLLAVDLISLLPTKAASADPRKLVTSVLSDLSHLKHTYDDAYAGRVADGVRRAYPLDYHGLRNPALAD